MTTVPEAAPGQIVEACFTPSQQVNGALAISNRQLQQDWNYVVPNPTATDAQIRAFVVLPRTEGAQAPVYVSYPIMMSANVEVYRLARQLVG